MDLVIVKGEYLRLATRPYIDIGIPGDLRYSGRRLLRVKEPPNAPRVIVTLIALRRHNSLEPELQPTNRVFLRWASGSGTGLRDPDVAPRESHFTPLPDNEHKIVDQMVLESPFERLMRSWYRTDLDSEDIAAKFKVSRTKLYELHKQALWYFRGKLETLRFDVFGSYVHGA